MEGSFFLVTIKIQKFTVNIRLTKAAEMSLRDINVQYINRVREMPMLSGKEEYELAKKWRDKGDQKAVEQLVSSHLKLVAKVASGYRGYGLPVSDLISEGNIGMMQAMKHFDPDKGFRLSTYALWWIKASIQEYILHNWSLVKIGTTAAQKKLFFNLRKEKINLSTVEDQSHELTPQRITEIAIKLSVKETEVVQMNRRLSGQDHSLNAPLKSSTQEGESEWQEWLVDVRETQDIEILEKDEMVKRRKALDQAMETLTPRERVIFFKRRLADPPKTLEDLSREMKLSRERIRQLELRTFEKLQTFIRTLDL